MVMVPDFSFRSFGAIVVTFVFIAACTPASHSPHFVNKAAVEKAHGLRLPASAHNCQQRRTGGVVDHGILSLFEMDRADLQPFLAQLKVKSREQPAKPGVGDPCLNGWSVWPTNASTFVPDNEELAGLKATWTEKPHPVEMLSCASSRGDWLHVEVWLVGNRALVKLYTDWN